jgi:hypothetical protein
MSAHGHDSLSPPSAPPAASPLPAEVRKRIVAIFATAVAADLRESGLLEPVDEGDRARVTEQSAHMPPTDVGKRKS